MSRSLSSVAGLLLESPRGVEARKAYAIEVHNGATRLAFGIVREGSMPTDLSTRVELAFGLCSTEAVRFVAVEG